MKNSTPKTAIGVEEIIYNIFYKNKLMQIRGQVIEYVDGEPIEQVRLKKYEKLFDLMVDSFEISNVYN